MVPNIDPEQVRKLAGWGLTQNDIASFVGWSQSLISLGFCKLASWCAIWVTCSGWVPQYRAIRPPSCAALMTGKPTGFLINLRP